jgi:2-polyprenyl-3-methyl-5-hydroxy-6-metoxy-1,4-benzoquinol methylase
VSELSDKKIIASWHTNAGPWVKAMQNEEIESRKLITNQAIVRAVSELKPQGVFDVGCGEGWLARAFAELGIEVFGVDAVPELVAEARRLGGGQFQVCSYEEMAAGSLQAGLFDAVVCNFSLIGKESVENLLRAFPRYLSPRGRLVIQTLHPVTACGDQPYADGWRPGSWDGFGPEFEDPAPWYFRTVGSWIRLLRESLFEVLECREPVHPSTGQPASIIFIGALRGGTRSA